MNRGGNALNFENTLKQDNSQKEFAVSNCGFFIAENSAHTMNGKNAAYLLVYLHKGRVRIPMPDGKSQTVHGGTVIIFKPCDTPKLSYLSDPINERYYVYFEGVSVERCLEKLKLADKRYYEVGDLSSQIKNFHKIIEDYRYHSFDDDIYRTTYFLNILTAISNIVNPTQKNYYPEIYKQILYDIEKHYFEKITLSSLTNKFSISISTLRRYFKKYADTSPMEYINDLRLEKAKFMLIESDMQISEISYSVGFDDALYFSKFFKNKMGLSPKSFRKKYQFPHDFTKK